MVLESDVVSVIRLKINLIEKRIFSIIILMLVNMLSVVRVRI